MKITVDGHEYTVERNTRDGVETVTVTIGYGDVVATAEIVHNVELIAVAYECYDSSEEILTSSYPYYEYTTAEALARWMVATHPEHQ